jgi:DNA-binding NtrC family response regulator
VTKPKLLIIDDEKGLLKILTKIFKTKNYDIHATDNPLKALQLIKTENFDLILLDLKMPIMNGLEFIEKTKDYNCNAHFLIITGATISPKLVSSIKGDSRIEGLIYKPFKIGYLVDIIKKCI